MRATQFEKDKDDEEVRVKGVELAYRMCCVRRYENDDDDASCRYEVINRDGGVVILAFVSERWAADGFCDNVNWELFFGSPDGKRGYNLDYEKKSMGSRLSNFC